MSKEPEKLDYFSTREGGEARRRLTRSILIKFLITVGIFLGLFVWHEQGLYFDRRRTTAQKSAWMNQQIAAVSARIGLEPRFANVYLGRNMENVFVPINGTVTNQRDLDALHKIVGATSPKLQMSWNVFVLPPTTRESAPARPTASSTR